MNDMQHFAKLLLDLCGAAGPAQTLDPGEIARIIATKDHPQSASAWPHYLQNIRDAAVALAREGRLIIYQKGAPADPDTFRGLYRLGCPNLG